MKRLIITTAAFLFSVSLFANSGPERSIEVYTKPNCPKCTAAVNFLKKNWGPVGWDTVEKGTLVYPMTNSEYKRNLESLFNNSTDVNINTIKFPVIIMRNAGEPFPLYYDIDNVENLLKCKLNIGVCVKTSYKSGLIKYGTYAEILTLDDNSASKAVTVTNPDGSVYTGPMKNGKMHGLGTLKYSNGAVYTGMLKDGKLNGQGIITFPNGDKYDGEWKNNLMDGYGTYNWANGSWYQGRYKNGKFNGEGTLTTAGQDGKQQSGTFKDGRFIGN